MRQLLVNQQADRNLHNIKLVMNQEQEVKEDL